MDFTTVEIRVGTVVAAEEGGGTLRLRVRFGPGDEREATSGISEHYAAADVRGRQVVAVMHPPGSSDAFVVLAAVSPVTGAVLLCLDEPVPDGTLVV